MRRRRSFDRTRPKKPRINGNIKKSPIMVVQSDGEIMGTMETEDALELARKEGLDLVEVAPNAKPPVCKLLDYGRYKYQQDKKRRSARKRQHSTKLKEIRLRPKIGKHDLDTKLKHAREFLAEGHRVQFNMFFRGREMGALDFGRDVLKAVLESMQDVAKVERSIEREGRRMKVCVAPLEKGKHSAQGKNSQGSREAHEGDEAGEGRT